MNRPIQKMKTATQSLDQLREKIRDASRPDLSGCWLWEYGVQKNGYGHLYWNGRTYRVHRLPYLAFVGPIPRGLYVCHHCDVRNCVCPTHLWLGTHLDNVKDMYQKHRNRGGKRSKLTQSQAEEILVSRFELGRTLQQLADQFNVDQSSIGKICRGTLCPQLSEFRNKLLR